MASSSGSQSTSASSARPLPLGLNARLSLMMFLQWAIWGAWLPLLLPYLVDYRHFEFWQIGYIFAVGAVGAIFAPFIAGQIADRYFSTERFLGICHLLGAVLVWQLATLKDFPSFLWFSLAYSIIYMPTLSLTNSLSFHHLPDRDRDFGRVRVWGTFGWICAGIGVAQWLAFQHLPADLTDPVQIATAKAAGMGDAFRLSAILGAILGVYCFTLPHTPPQKGKQAFATWEARGEVQRNSRLMALFLISIVISCIHQFYFVHTAKFVNLFQSAVSDSAGIKVINRIFGVGGGGLMTIGQLSELVTLSFMSFLVKRFSRKTLLAVGILAYAARMALFAYVEPISTVTGIAPLLVLIVGLALHGLVFGCFIFVAFLIVDEETTSDVRASAQSLYNLVVFGFGIIVGSQIATMVAEWATHPDTKQLDYNKLFSVPMWAALLTLVVFLFLYPGKKQSKQLAVSD